MALLLALLLAAPAGHRALAAQAEALGHMQAAAREYEAAWQEERAPDLLYRLGIVRRKLKQYGLAREALRAYLREAPDGGLRDEVVRQLAKLEVLIEAQSEDYTDAPPKKAQTKPAPPAARQPNPPPSNPNPIPNSDSNSSSNSNSTPAPNLTSPPAAAPNPLSTQIAPDIPNRAPSPAQSPAPDRSISLSLVPSAIPLTAAPRLAPYLLACGAVLTASAGGYLWWDGARLSNSLDTRFAAGDLSAADRALYSRAHSASVAGRVLVAVAAGLVAGAVALW